MTRRLRVYVAGPLSTNADLNKIAENVSHAVAVGGRLISLGYAPFVPHLTLYWHILDPRTWREWMEVDKAWVLASDALLRLPGASTGADQEVKWAHEAGIPVYPNIDSLDRQLGGREACRDRVEYAPPTRKISLGLEKLLLDWCPPQVSSTKPKPCVVGRTRTARTTGAKRK